MNATALIELRGVSKLFVEPLDPIATIARVLGSPRHRGTVLAVDEVDLSVAQGEVVGLVGESGCGKSTLGRIVAGLLTPNQGRMFYRGTDIAGLEPSARRATMLRIQMIFQDPFSSLNPRLRVKDIVGEAPLAHGIIQRRGLDRYVEDILGHCGLDPSCKRRYPHQFSGGQRQRIGIARALAVRPEFVVCDEAVAALDVSIQAQILNLFMKLRESLDLTYLFISHDLGVVKHISDRVYIMYLGRIVEAAPTEEIFDRPNHPYTQALLREAPQLTTRHSSYRPIEGEIPSPLNPPTGCHFHPRCPHATERCRRDRPLLRHIAPGHVSACHLNEQT